MIYRYEEAFNYENGFILTSDISRMSNILSHFELYKRIISLPGDVVELGVFKGNSLMQFATFRELLENENARKIIGFDAFGEFPMDESVPSDCRFIAEWKDEIQDDFLTKEELISYFQHKKIGNFELIAGDILETVDVFLEKNPALRIALLHIDTDVYAPSRKALEVLFQRVVRGGIVVFDDYGVVEGESLAAEEFLSDTDYVLRKFSFSHVKPSFFVKK